MQMYLKNSDNIFRFPVVPPAINIQDYAITNSSNITMLGDITIYGGKGLKSTEITSFFPSKEKNYKFVDYTDYPAPWECVNTISTWLQDGEILRFIVTDTNINFEVMITNFEYSEQDGTRDVYFTLALQEYRKIAIKTKDETTNDDSSETPQNNDRNDTNSKPINTNSKTHTVKKGDTLWDIAKKYYGKGSDYTKIVSNNKSKYPSLAKNTVIQVGWVLTI